MASQPGDIHRKLPFRKIEKYEGFINYKIIREIHRKIQANISIIQSELGKGHHGLLGLEIQPATYQTVTGKEIQWPAHPPQPDPVPVNAAADEVPGYIQHYAAQVDPWIQMVNAEDILKQQLLESLYKNSLKGQHQEYINYSKLTLAGHIKNL